MAGGEDEVEGVLPGSGFEMLEQVFDVAVEVEDHLANQLGVAADFKAQLGAGVDDQADEIEGIALAEAFLLDHFAEQFELGLLR